MFRLTACTCARAAVVCALVAGAACAPVDTTGDDSLPEQVLSSTPTGSETPTTPSPSPDTTTQQDDTPLASVTTLFSEVESNDTWETANAVEFATGAQLSGTIASGRLDVDLFDLGPAQAGRRLQADLLIRNGSDLQIGFFDNQGRVIAYVDPASPTAGPSRVDIVLREDVSSLYAMVATRSTSQSARAYSATVTLAPPSTVPSGNAQVVVLVFLGAGQVQIGSRSPVDVPPFDIADVNPEFAGRTDEAIELLLAKVRGDYDGLEVAFYRDSDPAIPAGDHSSVYFGTSDTRLLGLADRIDPFNIAPRQGAIIYTDTFSLFNQLHPTFDATVQVLANVTSHEVGHLLGLRHAADPQEIMDVTATARQMMLDQWFKTSSLHNSVMPLGVQDGPTLLAWGVGGALKPHVETKYYAATRRTALTATDDFYIPRSLLADCDCPECGPPSDAAGSASEPR